MPHCPKGKRRQPVLRFGRGDGCRRRWPIGLRRILKKSGYQIRKRPVIGVVRCLSAWANGDAGVRRTIYLWTIEKRDSELLNARSA